MYIYTEFSNSNRIISGGEVRSGFPAATREFDRRVLQTHVWEADLRVSMYMALVISGFVRSGLYTDARGYMCNVYLCTQMREICIDRI